MWHHPTHLRGDVFEVPPRNGKPLGRAEAGDTTLLDPKARAEMAFVADNPGNWTLHCHALAHQATGLMAVIRAREVDALASN